MPNRVLQRAKYLAKRGQGLCIEPQCGNPAISRVRCKDCHKKFMARANELRKKHASLQLNLKRNYKS